MLRLIRCIDFDTVFGFGVFCASIDCTLVGTRDALSANGFALAARLTWRTDDGNYTLGIKLLFQQSRYVSLLTFWSFS